VNDERSKDKGDGAVVPFHPPPDPPASTPIGTRKSPTETICGVGGEPDSNRPRAAPARRRVTPPARTMFFRFLSDPQRETSNGETIFTNSAGEIGEFDDFGAVFLRCRNLRQTCENM